MDREALKQACLAATVAVAWAGSSSPAVAATIGATETVYIRTNFYHSFAAAHFVAIRDLTWMIFSLGAIPAGESYRQVEVPTVVGDDGIVRGISAYNLIVAGPWPPPTLLGMGFTDPSQGLGIPFESVFPGVDEMQALAGVHGRSSDGGAALGQLMDQIISNPNMNLGVNAPKPDTMLHFTSGTLAGTVEASFTPIPEPAAGMIFLGAVGFGMLQRRRTYAIR